MSYYWRANIICSIENGRAVLNKKDNIDKRCDGICHSCDQFRGVDISQTGIAYLHGCCTGIAESSAR